MKHKVSIKIAFYVINPWSGVDRNTPVSLWGKVHAFVRKLVYPPPLRDGDTFPVYEDTTIHVGIPIPP